MMGAVRRPLEVRRLFTLVLIGLVGGLITGISPCILPVLPVIFLAGGAQGARRSSKGSSDPDATAPVGEVPAGSRPYLVVAGLTLSFTVFTLLGTLVLRALPVPQDIIRWVGLALLVLLGIAMIVPRLQDLLDKPFAWVPQRAVGPDRGGFVLGLALGAVYVPCAGPVLAAISVAGATGRIGAGTLVLTVSFAIGTAVPLLFFALAGRRLAERLKVFRSRQRPIRVFAGVVVILLAVALTFNITDAVQRAVPDYTSALNNAAHVAKALGGHGSGSLATCVQNAGEGPAKLENCGPEPVLAGISQWQNSAPLTLAGLKGKVVLVDFWAYSCINCQRAIQHVNAWYSAYRKDGLEVIGVHTPEYAFEHVPANVKAGAARLGIKYPVALDNDYKTWDAFGNDSWPADYLIDSAGDVRFVSIGEGDYDGAESLIRQLLSAANPNVALPGTTAVADKTPVSPTQTPETYLGSARAQYYGGDDAPLKDGTRTYQLPKLLPDDAFGLSGKWTVGAEDLTARTNAAITLNYDADDIYLDVGGTGTITATDRGVTKTYRVSGAPNIYPVLQRSTEDIGTLKVTLSPGLQAYSFTFG
jgi:cytochrome c biogenesis protein CcdA/thiol-disulfide isomerase/thioredoxin